MRKFLDIKKRRDKGFTLIEMLLTMTLSLIGIASVTTTLILGYRYFYLGNDITQIQQRAGIALEKMVKELRETSMDRIEPNPDSINSEENSSNIISFASARDENNNFLTDAEGMPDWTKAIVYFIDTDSNVLYRYKESKDNWDANYDISGFDSSTVSGEKSLVTSVTGLKFWFSGNNLLNIKIEVLLDSEIQQSSLELTTAIKIRN